MIAKGRTGKKRIKFCPRKVKAVLKLLAEEDSSDEENIFTKDSSSEGEEIEESEEWLKNICDAVRGNFLIKKIPGK